MRRANPQVDDLLLDIPQGDGPIYRRLSQSVRQALRQGRLRRGERLPSTRRLAQQLGVHRHTVMPSLDELVAEGWLESQPGWGYRVVDGATLTRLVVTHGCQEAIYLLAQLLLRPGDQVAVEELGFPNAWQALRCCGAELVPVDIDEHGLVPDSLERALASGRVKLLYLTPLHQYPTTVTLNRTRRQAVYRLCARHHVPILEDDYDFELHYRCMSVPPMKADDPEARVLYCSTFSKVLHPSARLGFAIVPAPVARLMRELKRVVSRQNDSLVQEAVAGWMAEGGFERHLRRMRRLYEERREVMLECLEGVPQAPRFRLPDGGMCLWVELGLDPVRVAEEALKLGVDVRPGPYYALDRTGRRGWDGFRLGFSYHRPDEIREGMSRFWQACAKVAR